MKAPRDLFYVDDQLRDEMKYWKDRRNDCAHFKNNVIGAPHIEAFWLYMRSSLGRWVPKGSMNDILDRIARHYDPNFTPRGADVSRLVGMMPQAVPPDKIGSFFDELVRVLTRTTGFPRRTTVDNEAISELINAIYYLLSTNIQDATSTWLCKQLELLLLVLRKHPTRSVILNNRHELVRYLWRDMLFNEDGNDLPLFASLLRNGIVPTDEINEAVSWVVDRVSGDVPSETDDQTLQNFGFWRALRVKAFHDGRKGDFAWANPKAKLLSWTIERDAIDVELASTICRVFGQRTYPFEVRDAIKEMFARKPEKLVQVETKAAEDSLSVPDGLR